MVEQAGASTEILNELILNKEQVGGWWRRSLSRAAWAAGGSLK